MKAADEARKALVVVEEWLRIDEGANAASRLIYVYRNMYLHTHTYEYIYIYVYICIYM